MRFVVEDGTGLPLANAFINVQYVDNYAEEMGRSDLWESLFDANGDSMTQEAIYLKKQQAIIQASRWLSANYIWLGTIANAQQGLAFPRNGIRNYPEPAFPYQIKEATASAAIRVMSGTILAKDAGRGGKIKSVKAGPVAVVYDDNAPTGTIYTEIENLIRELAVGLGGTEFITTGVRI